MTERSRGETPRVSTPSTMSTSFHTGIPGHMAGLKLVDMVATVDGLVKIHCHLPGYHLK